MSLDYISYNRVRLLSLITNDATTFKFASTRKSTYFKINCTLYKIIDVNGTIR